MLFPLTEQGKRFASFVNQLNRGPVDARRQAIAPARMARELGLTDEDSRVAVLATDQRLYPIIDTLERAKVEGKTVPNANELIRRMFEGEEPGVRPTPADVTNVADYISHRMDPERAAHISQVADGLKTLSAERADRLAGTLNPEQLGKGLLTPVVREVQGKLEAKREVVQRKFVKADEMARRAERISNAHEAVRAELETAPSATAAFRAGAQTGKLDNAAMVHRAALQRAQQELANLTDNYVTEIEQGGNAGNINRLAGKVEESTAKVNALLDEVRTRERRLQSANVLSKVGGEVVPGRPREVGGPGTLVPPKMNEADFGVGAVRSRVADAGAQQAKQIREYIDTAAGEVKPTLPHAGIRKKGGEGNFLRELEPAQRARLVKEGWFEAKGTVPLDEWAQMVNDHLHTDFNPDEAGKWYLDQIEQVRALEKGSAPSVLQQVADEMGLTANDVRDLMQGKGVGGRRPGRHPGHVAGAAGGVRGAGRGREAGVRAVGAGARRRRLGDG